MVKKKHKVYTLEALREGNTRMVDPYVNPDKDKYSNDFELGIDKHAGKRRWTIDTYKEREHKHKTEKMKKQQLKNIIKECVKELITENKFNATQRIKLPPIPRNADTHNVDMEWGMNDALNKLADLKKGWHIEGFNMSYSLDSDESGSPAEPGVGYAGSLPTYIPVDITIHNIELRNEDKNASKKFNEGDQVPLQLYKRCEYIFDWLVENVESYENKFRFGGNA